MQERNKKVAKKKRHRRLLSLFLTFAMALSMAGSMSSYAADGTQDGDGSAPARTATAGAVRTADGDTTDAYTLGEPDSTRYDGRVWVDKSVSAEDSVDFENGKTVQNNSDFLVTYSALATSTVVQGGSPVDVVFVLDLSTSMCWGTQTDKVTTENDSRIYAMVQALNESIDTFVKASDKNRIAISVFNGTGSVLMGLTETGDIKKQIQSGENYITLTNFDEAKERATIQCNMVSGKPEVTTAGGTNIQAGLYQGMNILATEKNTTYSPTDGVSVTRIPNVVVMSDGAPTTFVSSEDSEYRVNGGPWEKYNKIIKDTFSRMAF